MHLARTLVVASFVLLSSSTLSEAVLAESREPQAFKFKCDVPIFGKDRCGDADKNVRVGRGKRLLVMVETITPKPEAEVCFEFFAYHAVSGEQLGHVPRMCTLGKPEGIWANPKETPVDVFLMVGSTSYGKVTITGAYVVDNP